MSAAGQRCQIALHFSPTVGEHASTRTSNTLSLSEDQSYIASGHVQTVSHWVLGGLTRRQSNFALTEVTFRVQGRRKET